MNRPIEFLAAFSLCLARAAAFAVVAICALPLGANALDLTRFTASGTHVCGGPTERHCVVSGSTFQNCIDAANSLKVQDCCRTDLACSSDPKTGATKCESASTSTKFTLDYCVASRHLR
jgi:hypothetical protein